MGWAHSLNEKIGNSKVGQYFQLKERRSTFTTELRAGLVTFLTTSYILAVNSGILSDTGGTCSDADCTGPKAGQPGCRFTDPGFQTCVQEVRRSLISATAATSLMACFLMGAVANLPLAVAPGMGINAYFAYTVVGFYGSGMISYQEALAAVFIEGWIFILISVSGVRGKMVSLVPKSIMLATAGGIGLFLAFIGLQNSEGIGLVTYNSATLVTLGGCPRENRIYQYSIADTSTDAVCKVSPDTGLMTAELGPPSSTYMCKGMRMHLATMWLGIAGITIMAMLMARKVKGAIMFGILFTTFISWIPGHQASYLGEGSQVPGGAERYEFFKNVVSVPNASKTTLAWSFAAFGKSELWVALITFLYLDFLDATGTLFSMASMLNQRIPGFVNDKDNSFPRQLFAFCVDGVAIVIGSLLGCAPLTVYIESASGIREGGRTGITALVVAFGFFVALFFTPLIASIPPFATGPALILVGGMMMENLVDIDWSDVRHAIPAFITIVTMPMTYSIAYGVIAGICSYIVLFLGNFILDLIMVAFGKNSLQCVLYDNCPDAFKEKLRMPVPFKSPSAVLQYHVNPEHAVHHAAVKARDDNGTNDARLEVDNDADLPVKSVP
jgi:AGZA family xanthine/uracil permease-like MFS transporter